MTEIRPVRESDLPAFRRLHNRYIDRDESPATVRGWYEDHPELLVGAYLDGDLVGHCLGLPLSDGVVQLAGISVDTDYQRRGIGSDLLAEFEARAASLGFRRVTLGSAGGYVDEFYHRNGYDPESILVRLPPEELPENYRDLGYEVVEESTEDGVRKLYVGVEGFDPAVLADVRETFGDEEAIYVMEKDVATPR